MSEPNRDISIFEYTDYRRFLKDVYAARKAENKKFSFRFFARAAGFKSSNFLMLVMTGRRNLSSQSAAQVAEGLKLGKTESEFFGVLVMFSQAKKSGERQLFAEQLLRFRKAKTIHPLRESKFRYYTQWYYVVIRELVGVRGFREDPEWIAKRVSPPITPAQAKEAIEELLNLELIRRDAKGRLSQSEPTISTGDEVSSSAVAHFHREMMKLASGAIDSIAREHRDISSVTFLTSPSAIKKVKEMIQKFRQEVTQVLTEAESAEMVYQLNIQLFPVVMNEPDVGGSGETEK